MEAKWKRGYPKLSLEEALEKAKLIYEKEYTHPAPREVMATSMGYNGLNGASAAVLSALSQYGLIEPVGEDNYRVTEDTLNLVLHQRGESERIESVKRMAFSPSLFSELREKYPNNIPSDDNLKAFLIKRSYHPKAVKDIIKAYKETLQFFESETNGFEKTQTFEDKNKTENQLAKTQDEYLLGSEHPSASQENAPLIFKISRNSNVRIYFSGEVTQESIEKLINLLDLSKDTYPTEKELQLRS